MVALPPKAHSDPRDHISTPPSYERTILYYSTLYGVDYRLALAIATCESHVKPRAKNPNSTAKGLFQFLDSSWEYYGLLKWGTLEGRDVYDYGDNAELAVWLMARHGTRDWLASEHCWSRAESL